MPKSTNEYVVRVEGHEDILISEEATTDPTARQTKFQNKLMDEGITVGTDWFPPHRILKVERRDVA